MIFKPENRVRVALTVALRSARLFDMVVVGIERLYGYHNVEHEDSSFTGFEYFGPRIGGRDCTDLRQGGSTDSIQELRALSSARRNRVEHSARIVRRSETLG